MKLLPATLGIMIGVGCSAGSDAHGDSTVRLVRPAAALSDGMLAFEGSFALGRPLTCGDENPRDERNQVVPDRWNFVPAFVIDATPVSRKQYQECVRVGRCPDAYLGTMTERAIVEYESAEAYCKQRGARLPTYLEWQRATRGIGGDLYPTGASWDSSKGCFQVTEPELPGTRPDLDRPLRGCQNTSFDGLVFHVLSQNHLEWTSDTACLAGRDDGHAAAYIWDAELNKVSGEGPNGQFRCARSGNDKVSPKASGKGPL